MRDLSCHIEKLPEDILLRILQSLPLVGAVATSPLSRMWKNLWEKSCSQHLNLCFDVDNIIGVGMPVPEEKKVAYPDLTYYRKKLTLSNRLYYGLSSQIINDFIKGVDMIVQCRRGEEQDVLQGVTSLEIRFPLRGKHSYNVDKWISSTVTSITKQLILAFDMPTYSASSCIESELYEFPFELLLNQKSSSLEYLQLECISAKLPQNFLGFTTLRTLKLNHADITQEDFHKLLINCPLLEFLKIEECENLVALQVSSPLPHLRVLILRNCNRLTKVELWAENLSGFDYDAAESMDHLMFRGCHNLAKVAIISLYCDVDYRSLSNDFPFVTALYLDSDLKGLSAVLRDNIFPHLKFLAIFVTAVKDDRNLQYLSSLLNKVAPVLEELELHLLLASYSAKCPKINNQTIDKEPFSHLDRVAFTGFKGDKGQIMLAKYFLRMARRLQIMTLDPLVKLYRNFDAIGNPSEREINKRCRKAYKLLCQEVPENVKLILVGDN